MRLEGKTVLITGAGSGIGRALACEAAGRGAKLVLAGRRETPLGETVGMLGAGAMARIVVADVATADGRSAIVEELGGVTGRLDVLVNNAGTLTVGPLSSLDDKSLERMILTNLAAFWGHLGAPVVHDEAATHWSLGEPPASGMLPFGPVEAPDFTLPDATGQQHSLSDYRGQKVLLAAWASW